MSYFQTLIDSAKKNRSLISMGADPIIEKIPIHSESVEETIFNFYANIIDALFESDQLVGAIKPNYAFYAQYGFEGLRALRRLIAYSREKGLPVILDVKRGDIGTTSAAYANEAFEFFKADAITISPYMGSDSVSPFIKWSKIDGKGVYILARTSNIGATDLQNILTSDGSILFLKVIEKISEWAKGAQGNVGAVVGATSLIEFFEIAATIAKNNQIMPLLIPGVGAQGGSATDVITTFIKAGRQSEITETNLSLSLLTLRINSSSGINYAYEKNKDLDYVGAAVNAVKDLNREINSALKKEQLILY